MTVDPIPLPLDQDRPGRPIQGIPHQVLTAPVTRRHVRNDTEEYCVAGPRPRGSRLGTLAAASLPVEEEHLVLGREIRPRLVDPGKGGRLADAFALRQLCRFLRHLGVGRADRYRCGLRCRSWDRGQRLVNKPGLQSRRRRPYSRQRSADSRCRRRGCASEPWVKRSPPAERSSTSRHQMAPSSPSCRESGAIGAATATTCPGAA
jgi:hypothetical protein